MCRDLGLPPKRVADKQETTPTTPKIKPAMRSSTITKPPTNKTVTFEAAEVWECQVCFSENLTEHPRCQHNGCKGRPHIPPDERHGIKDKDAKTLKSAAEKCARVQDDDEYSDIDYDYDDDDEYRAARKELESMEARNKKDPGWYSAEMLEKARKRVAEKKPADATTAMKSHAEVTNLKAKETAKHGKLEKQLKDDLERLATEESDDVEAVEKMIEEMQRHRLNILVASEVRWTF